MSLLLAVAAAALWVRSWYSFDTLSYSGRASEAGQRGGSVSSHRGGIQVEWYVWRTPMDGRPPAIEFHRRPVDRSNEAGYLENAGARGGYGFWLVRRTQPRAPRPGEPVAYAVRDVFVPDWFVVALASALPLWRTVVVARARRRRVRGRCPSCGYDLTANVSGVCPECGSPRIP